MKWKWIWNLFGSFLGICLFLLFGSLFAREYFWPHCFIWDIFVRVCTLDFWQWATLLFLALDIFVEKEHMDMDIFVELFGGMEYGRMEWMLPSGVEV